MFRVDLGDGSYILFEYKMDADNYKDYLKNGLKVVRTSGKSFFFNNGDRLIDVSLPSGKVKKYVAITRKKKKIKSEKLLRKYIKAIV